MTPTNENSSLRRDPFDLTGKVAIVTGGNGGIGLGIALGLAEAGAKLAIVARNLEKSKQAQARIARDAGAECLIVTADLASEQNVKRAADEVVAHFGRIDVLVNNAGMSVRKLPHELSLDDWHTVLNVNLTAAFLMSKGVYPALKQAGGGKIINIGSMSSIFGIPFAAPYATSKGGIVQLTKSHAIAWAPDRIQVNAILPGWFDTDLTRGARRDVPGLHERVLARTPQGRWGEPADIAGTAVWLASSASDYVTGAAIAVDGGYSAAL